LLSLEGDHNREDSQLLFWGIIMLLMCAVLIFIKTSVESSRTKTFETAKRAYPALKQKEKEDYEKKLKEYEDRIKKYPEKLKEYEKHLKEINTSAAIESFRRT